MHASLSASDWVAPAATPAAGMSRIDIVADPSAFSAIVPAWRRLVEASDGAVSVFQTPEWIEPAVARLSGMSTSAMRLAVISDANGTALIAPLEVAVVGGVRILKWLGDPMFEYGDVVARADVDASALFAAVVDRLRRDDAIDLVHLRKVRGDAAVASWLADAATPLPGAVRAPFADLSADNPDCAHATKADRRKRRRLAEYGDLAFSVHRGGEAAERLARQAIALKRQWLDARGLFSRTLSDDACVEAVAAAVRCPGSGACVSALTIDGEPIAIEIGFASRRTYYSYLAAIEPRYARYSPGRLQMADTIAWCRRNGIDRVDLLGTEGAYKERVSNGSVAVGDFMAPLTVAGALYGRLGLGLLRPAAKALYGRAPVVARVALKRVATARAARRGLIGAAAITLLGITAIIVE